MFKKTGIKEAEEMISWKYEGIYSYYNIGEHEKVYLYTTTYYNSFDNKGVEGFFCTGYEATMDLSSDYEYDDRYLDIGFGLRPDLCGKGRGETYIKSILKFLNKEFNEKNFRLTVAKFNKRAISLYEKIGFKKVRDVVSKYDKEKYIIMVFNIVS